MTILRDEQLKNRPSITRSVDRFLYCPKGAKSYLVPTQALLGSEHSVHVLCGLTLNLLVPTTVGARINPWATNVIYIYIYIYGAPILDVSRSHTTTHHSR